MKSPNEGHWYVSAQYFTEQIPYYFYALSIEAEPIARITIAHDVMLLIKKGVPSTFRIKKPVGFSTRLRSLNCN